MSSLRSPQWRFEEQSGPTVIDSMGKVNGTLSDATRASAGLCRHQRPLQGTVSLRQYGPGIGRAGVADRRFHRRRDDRDRPALE